MNSDSSTTRSRLISCWSCEGKCLILIPTECLSRMIVWGKKRRKELELSSWKTKRINWKRCHWLSCMQYHKDSCIFVYRNISRSFETENQEQTLIFYLPACSEKLSKTGLYCVILEMSLAKWPLPDVKEKHSVLTLKEAFLCVKAILHFLPVFCGRPWK